MEAVNGVSEIDKGGPPAPSPLTGCYLLIVVGEPHSKEHKDIILRRIAKGLLSWDSNNCHVDLEKELAIINEQAPEGEDARYGERLIQFASENLVTEVLIHPAISTLSQCMKNLLSSFTRHRHIIHAGYTFAGNGSWILQDGTFSLTDFSEAFQEIDVQRVLRAYDNTISLDVHCSSEGDWSRLPKESFAKNCKLRVNPDDVLTSGSPAIVSFLNYISPFLVPTDIEMLLESSDVVGNIRFSHPTLYVFPGGQGDAALFGINGFNMLVDGGFGRKACFWDFVRHLDRLDAVLLTRLNNSNVNGISSVLRRKRHNTVYPHIGHFFCNIQERKAILSPDGDKDKDPLLINLFEEGQDIMNNLRQLNLQPQPTYREVMPMNLYHKVGHGTLDMYILSPSRDSKEVKEFLQKWNNNDQRLFSTQKNGKEFVFPTCNLVSICALLVWQPANMNDNITRILFPGSSPQHKIFEGLDKLKQLECIKYPSCSAKTLTSTIIKAKISKTDKIVQDQKEIKLKSVTDSRAKTENKIVDEDMKNGHTNGITQPLTEKVIRKHDSTESEKSGPQIIETKKAEVAKDLVNGKSAEDKLKQKPRMKPYKSARSLERKTRPPVVSEKKASPTTPKKTVEAAKMNGDAVKIKPIAKTSPSATPAKSTKDANNRKVVESKIKAAPRKEAPKPSDKKEVKPERKPISRRPKGTSPVGKVPESPIKKISELHKIDTRKPKLEKECTTDSSTVSTPSADVETTMKKDLSKLTPEEIDQLKARELAELKEEQEVVKELEAVFRKGESKEPDDSHMRKIKNISIDEKIEGEGEEYLIVEKEELDHDSLDDREAKESETQKHLRDSEESEKQRKLSDVVESIDVKEKPADEVKAVVALEQEIIPTVQGKEEKEVLKAISKEVSVTSPDDKVEESSEKKMTDREADEEIKDLNILESQPDEKFSTPIESGATTAPTLPEDERIPLDEIKEDNGDLVVEEKYVKEDTKEKEVPIVEIPPKTVETKIPSVVGIRLDKQTPMRDIVKTPDEVADLPVHEEVDIENYEQYQANQAQTPKQSELKLLSAKPKSHEAELPDNENVEKVQEVDTIEKADLEKQDDQKNVEKSKITLLEDNKVIDKPVEVKESQIVAASSNKDVIEEPTEQKTIERNDIMSESKPIILESAEKTDLEKTILDKETEEKRITDEKSGLKELDKEVIDENKFLMEDIKEPFKDAVTTEIKTQTAEKEIKIEEPKIEDELPLEYQKGEISMEHAEVKVEKIHDSKTDGQFIKEAVEEDEKEKDTTEDLKTDVEHVEEIQLSEKIQLVEAHELIKEVKQDIHQLQSELLVTMDDTAIEKDIVIDALKDAEETVASAFNAVKSDIEEREKSLKRSESIEEDKDIVEVESKREPKVDEDVHVLSDVSVSIAITKDTENEGEEKHVTEVEKLVTKDEDVALDQEKAIAKKIEVLDDRNLDTVQIQLDNESEVDTEDEGLVDRESVMRSVREDSLKIDQIDKKLQELKDSVDSDIKPTTNATTKESALIKAELDMVDKMELGRKSPKEREQDVAIIVASVAEVLKSDAPLEEFEGKIPLDVGPFASFTPYATELRETHITTLESPIRDVVVETIIMDPIEEEKVVVSDPTTMFINEEKRIASVHLDYDTPKEPSRVSSLLKDSNDLIEATSKIISDIKQTTKLDTEAHDSPLSLGKSSPDLTAVTNEVKLIEKSELVKEALSKNIEQTTEKHEIVQKQPTQAEVQEEPINQLISNVVEQDLPHDTEITSDKDEKSPLGEDLVVSEQEIKKQTTAETETDTKAIKKESDQEISMETEKEIKIIDKQHEIKEHKETSDEKPLVEESDTKAIQKEPDQEKDLKTKKETNIFDKQHEIKEHTEIIDEKPLLEDRVQIDVQQVQKEEKVISEKHITEEAIVHDKETKEEEVVDKTKVIAAETKGEEEIFTETVTKKEKSIAVAKEKEEDTVIVAKEVDTTQDGVDESKLPNIDLTIKLEKSKMVEEKEIDKIPTTEITEPTTEETITTKLSTEKEQVDIKTADECKPTPDLEKTATVNTENETKVKEDARIPEIEEKVIIEDVKNVGEKEFKASIPDEEKQVEGSMTDVQKEAEITVDEIIKERKEIQFDIEKQKLEEDVKKSEMKIPTTTEKESKEEVVQEEIETVQSDLKLSPKETKHEIKIDIPTEKETEQEKQVIDEKIEPQIADIREVLKDSVVSVTKEITDLVQDTREDIEKQKIEKQTEEKEKIIEEKLTTQIEETKEVFKDSTTTGKKEITEQAQETTIEEMPSPAKEEKKEIQKEIAMEDQAITKSLIENQTEEPIKECEKEKKDEHVKIEEKLLIEKTNNFEKITSPHITEGHLDKEINLDETVEKHEESKNIKTLIDEHSDIIVSKLDNEMQTSLIEEAKKVMEVTKDAIKDEIVETQVAISLDNTQIPDSGNVSPELHEEVVLSSSRTSTSDAKDQSPHASGKSSPTSFVEQTRLHDKDLEVKTDHAKDKSDIVAVPLLDTQAVPLEEKVSSNELDKEVKDNVHITKDDQTKPEKMAQDKATLESEDRVTDDVKQSKVSKDLIVEGKGKDLENEFESTTSPEQSDTDVIAEVKHVLEDAKRGLVDSKMVNEVESIEKVIKKESKSPEGLLADVIDADIIQKVDTLLHKEIDQVEKVDNSFEFSDESTKLIQTNGTTKEFAIETKHEECAKIDDKYFDTLLQDSKSEMHEKLNGEETSSDQSYPVTEEVAVKEKSQMSSGKVSPDVTVKEVLAADKSITPPDDKSGSGKISPVVTLEGKETTVSLDQSVIETHDVNVVKPPEEEHGTSGKSSPEVLELTKGLLDTKQSPVLSRISTPEIIVDNEFVDSDRLSPEVDDETEKVDAKFESKTIHIAELASEVPSKIAEDNDATQVPSETEKTLTEAKTEEYQVIVPKSQGTVEPSLDIVSKAGTSSVTKTEFKEETSKEVEVADLSSGRNTPPTAPVSPIFKEKSAFSSDKTVEKVDVPVAKVIDIRSATPASDDCDISSGQVSRVLTTEEDDDKQVYSDEEEIPGSPLSATSQVAHSISSQYDFEDSVRGTVVMDPMSTSFYGALPDDPVDLSKEVRTTFVEDSTSVAFHDSPSHIYEITTAKFASIHLQAEPQHPDQKADIMTASFIGSELPSESKVDPIASWGKPLGLPSPAPLNDNKGTPKKEKKVLTNVMFKNRINEDKKSKKVNPVYVDLTYVPHNGNSNYSYVDFFKRVRARYYVFSGIEPSKEVYSALLEAKQTWDDKDLEVTIIPTYDTDVLGYWVAENEDLLAKHKIDLSPSASRCTINLQDHETSCSAYRLEFS